MAGKADAFLKICTALSLLGAAGSLGYYYSIYLPARDLLLDRERQLDRAHAEFAAKAAADRAKGEKEAAEQKVTAEKALAQMNYDSCVARAGEEYSRTWAFNCKQIAERAQKARATCTSDKSFCDNVYWARHWKDKRQSRRIQAASVSDLRRSFHLTQMRRANSKLATGA